MNRLCERPGCSEVAALAYGMRTEDLVFWIDVLSGASHAESSVLCQRHGDSMTVPRGWTLDDLRDPDLHLFRPPPRPDGPATRRNRARRRTDDDTGQLALGGLVDIIDEIDEAETAEAQTAEAETAEQPSTIEPASVEPASAEDVSVQDEPMPADPSAADPAVRSKALDWKPAFDDGDDLDGLLAARSPLLSRAFRGERG
ncbi:MAG: DUF3499 family protein [Ilumatobacter sp.]|uniref:DUF3499 family protein n=1 Tax=Ilumatobacter sp. TaxID=1967498 RepID=UPI003C77FF4B